MVLLSSFEFSYWCMRRLLPHRLHAYAPAPPPDETPKLPPSPPSPLLMLPHPLLIFSLAYNLYAAAGPASYASDAALTPLTPPCTRPTCLQHCLPSLRLQCPSDMPLTLLTILMLAVPSRHASDAPLTLA
ncbi:hypothetical protein O181_013019 [Austropuccinia psidii MF-1]|uniref:Uncharacterized protein n=1 Tax=Austropuccinia psidii MF-1 TaxID=1389203 RepID=A0A9Q3GNF3_9BASI|nr:hypothetical protein [Austropuccinia psidii MF-1]